MIRIGISGWRYANWRGVFYPEGLPQRRELEFAARHFDSVEINGSFYSLQRPQFYRRWYEETPDDFLFAVKGGRFITHMKKLADVEAPLANFFASGVLCLEHKLGPILWQFPASFGFVEERWKAFLDLLPRDFAAASRPAQRHDARMQGRSATAFDTNRPIRHAVEVRHSSLFSPAFIELLAKHRIAFVVADTGQRFPYAEDVTSDFVYVRLHGDQELYFSRYSLGAIRRYARRVEAWSRGGQADDAILVAPGRALRRQPRDVYVYFDNDAKVHAPFDAFALGRALGRKTPRLPRPKALESTGVTASPARAR